MAQITQTVVVSQSQCGGSLRLLLDESASISAENWQKQVNATADAIRDPGIVRLLTKAGGTALGVDSFDNRVRERVSWTIIRSQADAERFSSALRAISAHSGQARGETNIGRALLFSLGKIDEMQDSPCRGEGIIDISTDADNNGDTDPHGYLNTVAARGLLETARKQAEEQGWRINGIGVDGETNKGEKVFQLLERDVITKRTGGFAVGTSWQDYGTVIRDKLSREIAQLQGVEPVDSPGPPAVPQLPRLQLAKEESIATRK